MMRNGRMFRGNLTDLILLGVFITLAYVFIQRRGYMSKVDSVLTERNGGGSRELQAHDESARQNHGHLPRETTGNTGTLRDPLKIDDRIKKIQDARSPECQSQNHNVRDKVSIVITFFDYQFYDLKVTIDSVRLHTPDSLIQEIIIVDEGSTLDYIKDDARLYASKINAKLIRLEQREGSGKARVRGVHKTTGVYIVFLDTNTIVNTGWLEPLIDLVQREETTIAVPHYDNVNDPVSYEYSKTNTNMITVFTWSLTMRMYQNPDVKTSTEPIQSPVIRGNAFAIHKQMFIELGGYDEDMRDFAAENLEFSFRAWMCGAKVKVVPCSRVGILHLKSPVVIMRKDNIRRIAEVWLGTKKGIVYKSANVIAPKESTSYESQIIATQIFRMEQRQCRKFNWYLSNVANKIYTPSLDAKLYGLLKVRSGGCAKIAADTRIDLTDCKAESYQLHPFDRFFELTDSGMLRNGDKCLKVQSNAYVLAEPCDENDTKFKWKYSSDEKLINEWSNYCGMHVTDPDKLVPQGRQIFMVQECDSEKDGAFTNFEFIST